jgi:hypothetical protein
MAVAREQPPQLLAQLRLVVDDEDVELVHDGTVSRRGGHPIIVRRRPRARVGMVSVPSRTA